MAATSITDAASLERACSSYSQKHARYAERHAFVRAHEKEVGALHCGAREVAASASATAPAAAAAAAWKEQARSKSQADRERIHAAQQERDRLAAELSAERRAIEEAQQRAVAAAAAEEAAEAKRQRAEELGGFESDDELFP